MSLLSKFTFLMKGELAEGRNRRRNSAWVIDERKCLSMSEIQRLRKLCNKAKSYGLKNRKFTAIRDWFMIELGLNTGLRVGEMASLKHGDLLIDEMRSSIIVFGKGNKKRTVWISSNFKQACHYYISVKRGFGCDTDDESYLLNNHKGTMISKRSLQKSFKSILARAGLLSHYHIHCLRHTYTTFLLKVSNYNYRFVQKQLGHASIRTTQIYASVLEDDGKKALEQLYQQYNEGSG
jgi:site-specific recombinase XerD